MYAAMVDGVGDVQEFVKLPKLLNRGEARAKDRVGVSLWLSPHTTLSLFASELKLKMTPAGCQQNRTVFHDAEKKFRQVLLILLRHRTWRE